MAFPADYSLYQEITIDNTKVAADQTDFVVYVDLSDLDTTTDIFDTCRSDGGDIRVTKSDGTTELAREVVDIDTTAKTGELHFKFSGTLSSTADTTVRIWYNGTDTEPAVGATYGRNAVWSDYEAVLHLEEDPSGSAPQMVDSTGNGHDGTSTGTMTSGDSVSAILGNGLDFDGSNDAIDVATVINLGTLTLSCWINQDSYAGQHYISKRDSTANGSVNLDSNSGEFRFFFYAGAWKIANATDNTAGTDTFLAGTYDGTTGELYLNNTNPANVSYSGSIANYNVAYDIGRQSNGSNYVDGRMDEVRIRSGALSATWMTTEYNNQSSPSTFYSAGAEQGGGGGGAVPTTNLNLLTLRA